MTDPQRELLPPDDAELSALLDQAGSIDPRVWPRALAELVDVFADYFLHKPGLDASSALAQAQGVVVVLANHFGGRMMYVPRDDKLRIALRDNEIWRAHDGRNVQALAARYDLTSQQIYGILREQREINRVQK
jgi:Mor family transcriptional regulator